MLIETDGSLHLTYCTNIHPGDGWEQVDANLRRFAPALKAKLSPAAPFGIGLRLSAREARELLEEDRLDKFKSWLEREGLYVALINGFPYGPFHGTVVKDRVYAPDWRDDARVVYTLDLIRILRRLVPEGADGGISTAPLSYKPWLKDYSEAGKAALPRLVQVAEALVRVRLEGGPFIHLDIEPEPDCLIETTEEATAFFDGCLLPLGGPMLARALAVSLAEARTYLVDHLQLCFDCCHAAVEYEDPEAAVDRIQSSGLRIGRVQLSSALEVFLPGDGGRSREIARRLRPFADSTYLHQVIERRGTRLSHFPDLPDALRTAADSDAKQWRIHFHVPLFTGEYDGLGSTQRYVQRVLEYARQTRFTRHLEIETYTWDVLPAGLKMDLRDSIAREYEWVLANLRVPTTDG